MPRQLLATTAAILAAAATIAGDAAAQEGPAPISRLTIVGGSRQERACTPHQDVVIRGDGAQVVLGGPCNSLSIDGRDNRVVVSLVPGARITVGGGGNRVAYQLLAGSGDPPVIEDHGTDNSIGESAGTLLKVEQALRDVADKALGLIGSVTGR